jgi:putative nucleotidyltransferase with HDIG domain/PAS domain S-box-containing protein
MRGRLAVTPGNAIIEWLKYEIRVLREELLRSREREKDLDGTRRAMLYLLEDLNETSSEVLDAKNEWETTFDSISDPLFIHDAGMLILRCNSAYRDASGMNFQEIIGRPYYEVFPRMPGPFEECIKSMEDGIHKKKAVDVEVPGMDRVFSLRVYPVMNTRGEQHSSVHILEDVTGQRRAETQAKVETGVIRNLLQIAEATATTTTDLDRLMGRVVECVRKIMGCDACLAYLLDDDTGKLMPSEASGLPHRLVHLFRTEPLDKGSTLVRRSLEEGPLMVKNDKGLIHSSGLFTWMEGLTAVAIIPLESRQRLLGQIICIFTGPGKTSMGPGGRGRPFMQGIAHQVSVALNDARLFKETEDKTMSLAHKIETINTMHEIDRSILSTFETPEILETAVRMVGKLMACDRATIALVDEETDGLKYAAGFGTTSVEKGAVVPFDETSAADVIRTSRPQYASNLGDEKGLKPLEKAFLGEGFLSHIRVPLVVKGEAVGVLNVGSKRPSAFTPDDLSILENISSQIGVAPENSRLRSDLEDLFLGTVRSLSDAIDAKSPWTHGHSERVTKYALDIGRHMGYDDERLKTLELAGLLHDIGKLGTYEHILDKPGALTEEEMKIMMEHPVKGELILAHIKQLKHILSTIRHHHEFYDGAGYPDGIKGEEIPLMARILTVADTADAMGADRPYRKGKPMGAIIAELKRCSGTQFDPEVVNAFIASLERASA